MKRNEFIKISFLGLKLECTNPTATAIIMLLLLLTFFVVLVVLLPDFMLIGRFFLSNEISAENKKVYFYQRC